MPFCLTTTMHSIHKMLNTITTTTMPHTSYLRILCIGIILVCECAEVNGNVVSMWCAPFRIIEMLGDVNHWLMGKFCVISDTHAYDADLMLVICENHSFYHFTIFLFSPSFSVTCFRLCFPCHLMPAHPF